MKPQIENSLGDLKDKVVNASDLAFPSITPTLFEKYSKPIGNHVGYDGIPSNRQIVALIDYCNQNNLIPEDLIAFHREHSKSKIKATKRLKSAIPDEVKESKHLNWRENMTKKKTGQ